jgi:hypothetical protein
MACAGNEELGDAGRTGDAAGDNDAADDTPGGDGAATGGPDITAPEVISNDPLDEAAGEGISGPITATFNEAMAPDTLTDASFSVKHEALVVPGVVTYFNNRVSFAPTSPLALDTVYTVTVSVDATDLAGNALATLHSWRFTTDATPALGPAPVRLGAAGNYVILAKSAISTVPTSKITGDVGLSPAAASYVTGFSPKKAGTKWTSTQVVGAIFAADNDPPTPSNLTTAVSNMETAYTDAAGRLSPIPVLNMGAGTIGGLTLTPGLYKWTTSVTIPTDVTLSGAPNDVWIFQITGDLKMSVAKRMILSGGARPKNIFWQVAGFVELGSQAHAEGVVLSKTAIRLGTGASINGRLLAQKDVTLASSTVTAPQL